MRALSNVSVGLRVGLAVILLAIAAFGWIWTAQQPTDLPAHWISIAALVLLAADSLLIVSLAHSGTGIIKLLQNWPFLDLETVAVAGPARDALARLKGQWKAEHDKSAALQQRIAELERELQEVRQADSKALDDMIRLYGAISDGVLHQRLDEKNAKGDRKLVERFNQMAATLDGVVGDLKTLFARMADGDLSSGLSNDYRGDFAVIREAAGQAIERLGDVIGTIVQAANTISGATVQLTKEAQGLAESAAAQSDRLDHTAADAASLSDAARANEATAKRANQQAEQARAAAENGVQVVSRSIEAMNEMAEMSQRISEITSLINEIAFQTNLLALNASVEAARAGEAGKGFAVVAQEVRALAQRSANASKDIGSIIKQSNDKVKSGVALVRETGTVLSQIVDAIDTMGQQLHEIEQASTDQSGRVDGVSHAIIDMNAATRGYLSMVQRTGAAIQDIDQQVANLATQIAFVTTTADHPCLVAAQKAAAQISTLFESALDRGELSLDDLFDENYVPVKGSNPQQFMTRFVSFTDKVLPDIQEPLLKSNSAIAFCAAVDRNGYLPTHNLKYCQPQGDDPVWNAANSRNRRMFNDTVGLACGRNTKPYLLQCYRRDMGGGVFILMKDMSAPITVRGRHWGGFRIGYKT
ncbi:MAG TPA: methyl-accepting chemotaxis protein [Ferrovibrio sp.]|uniref:methyl-accepting chemotaxis protein n=1 Tax=Ferrovibrio sp. TaxID=1917215 RepID=UPI002ED146AA